MQFAVRLNSYRIVIILFSVAGLHAAQGQDPPPPTVTESAQNPSWPAVPVAVTQAQNSTADLNQATVPQTQSPVARPLSTPGMRNGNLPGEPMLQASTIDQAQTVSDSDRVNPIATSVVEGLVQPATFNQPRTQNPSSSNTKRMDLDLPREMMEQFDLSRASAALPGRPVTLLELLRKTRVAYRRDMISQYWKTYAHWAMLQNSKEYQNWLQQMDRPQTSAEQVLLSAAQNEAESQVMSSEIQLGISQQRLQQLGGMPTDWLPLPKDVPLIKGYQTHYEWFSSRNLVPSHLRGINHRLPLQLNLISQQAETVRIAKSAMNQTRMAFVSGQLGVAAVLEAGRMWSSGSQQLIETVTQYNRSIADYAIAIHPDFKSPDQIVAMLISRPDSVTPENTAQSVLDNTLPVARAADRSFGQPGLRSSSAQNLQPLNTTVSGNTGPSTGSSVAPQPLRTARGGPLAPFPSQPSPLGTTLSRGSATSPTTTSSSASVLETGLPGVRPNLIPLSATSPPSKESGNGFSPLPSTTPKVQSPTKPSPNGFNGVPVNPPAVTPPATNNNSFGGGSFGGS